MFQQLDKLTTGSLFIITGQAGAGKSHLAASARKSGTGWVLDTKGAVQTLRGKADIHADIQVMPTLSFSSTIMIEVRMPDDKDTNLSENEQELLHAFRIAIDALVQADLGASVRSEAISLIRDTLLAHAACHLALNDWHHTNRLSFATVEALKQATSKTSTVQPLMRQQPRRKRR